MWRFMSMLREEAKGVCELFAGHADIAEWVGWQNPACHGAIDESAGARLSDSSIGSSVDSVTTVPLAAAGPFPDDAKRVEAQAAAVEMMGFQTMVTARFEALEAKITGLAAEKKALEGRVAAAEAEAAVANVKADAAQAEAAAVKAQLAALLKAAPLPMLGTAAEGNMPLPVLMAAVDVAQAADQLPLIAVSYDYYYYYYYFYYYNYSSQFNGREQTLLWAVANGVKWVVYPLYQQMAALDQANSWTQPWVERLIYDVGALTERANAGHDDLNILRAEVTANLNILRDGVKTHMNQVVHVVNDNHARLDSIDALVRGLALPAAGANSGGVASAQP